MHYTKYKRSKEDYCNICEKYSHLTWDHVPPKFCENNELMKINDWFSDVPRSNEYQYSHQNGNKYRTICADCNNRLLGSRYDVELEQFYRTVKSYITSRLELPHQVKIECKINMVVRAIVGHILAASVEYDKSILIDKGLRKFFLDETALPPANLSLLIRIYPYKPIMLMRNVYVTKAINKNNSHRLPLGVISTMSFFPIGLVLCKLGENCGLLDLFRQCTQNINAYVSIYIDRKSCMYPDTKVLRHMRWPCNIEDSPFGPDMVLASSEAQNAVQAVRDKDLNAKF